ncbi:MAG: hypothetical protein JXX29_02915 [Deltaproteobacteria bacterium]|nr:hypothetical protein [Deltaproteobacteria bacterium]MBN2670594.1 hypothetical protein [Deltaproteobacteria bacterium]
MEANNPKGNRIMCDNCTDFAKATLDGRNLCAGCLLSELMSSQEAALFDKLVPLSQTARSSSQPPQA